MFVDHTVGRLVRSAAVLALAVATALGAPDPAAAGVTTGNGSGATALAPPGDGARIALTMQIGLDTFSVVTTRPDGTDLRVVAPGSTPEWSPDHRHLAFVRPAPVSTIAVADTLTGVVVDTGVVAAGVDTYSAPSLSWSPDGRSLAYVRDERVSVMSTTAPYDARVLGPRQSLSPSWSPDSATVYLTHYGAGGQYDVYRMPADGGPLTRLTATPDNELWASLSPDGTRLASERGTRLMLTDLDGGHAVAVAQPGCCSAPRWSPSGASVIALDAAQKPVIVSATTGAVRRVPHSPSSRGLATWGGPAESSDEVLVSVSDVTTHLTTGPSTARVTVRLERPTGHDVSVPWLLVREGYSVPSPFTDASGVLILPAGTVSAVIDVPLAPVPSLRNARAVLLLHDVSGGRTDKAGGRLAVAPDRQNLRVVQVGTVTVEEGDGGTQLVSLPVTITHPSSSAVTLTWSTAPQTASPGSDYTTSSGTLRFAPGQASAQVVVPVRGGTVHETHEERLDVTVQGTVDGEPTSTTAPLTIIDND